MGTLEGKLAGALLVNLFTHALRRQQDTFAPTQIDEVSI
jgi:hypothetical protein